MLTQSSDREKVTISNYGKSIFAESEVCSVEYGGLPIGGGMSYGDSAISDKIALPVESFVEINPMKEVAICSSGLTIEMLIRESIKHKLIPFVMPGTSKVTIGGAIASNIHGKSSFYYGYFCDHLTAITIRLTTGETVIASRKKNSDLFHATCGGMGSTGQIIGAEIKLNKVEHTGFSEGRISTPNLEATLKILDGSLNYVAWIDTSVSNINKIGRGTVYYFIEGNNDVPLSFKSVDYPLSNRFKLINNITGFLLSKIKYHIDRHLLPMHKYDLPIDSVQFPLDKINNWRNAYGKKGLYQFQGLFPEETASYAISTALSTLKMMGHNPFLVSLKKTRQAETGNITFCGNGYILAIDFSANEKSKEMILWLNEFVTKSGGKIYGAKDMFATKEQFIKMYSDGYCLQKKAISDMDKKINSRQLKRYGLVE